MDWDYFNKNPNKIGWYAVAYCWDPVEGSMAEGMYWDGKSWKLNSVNYGYNHCDYPIFGFSKQLFNNKEEADEWGFNESLKW